MAVVTNSMEVQKASENTNLKNTEHLSSSPEAIGKREQYQGINGSQDFVLLSLPGFCMRAVELMSPFSTDRDGTQVFKSRASIGKRGWCQSWLLVRTD